MRRVTQDNYRRDPYFERVSRAVSESLNEKEYVAPVEMFQKMGLLTPEDYQNWRMARVPFLEKVIGCNLERAGRILRILALMAKDGGLKPSQTDYRKWGKGGNIRLRFSKSGDLNLEEAWSRHYCRVKRKVEPVRDVTPELVDEVAAPKAGSGSGEEGLPPPRS